MISESDALPEQPDTAEMQSKVLAEEGVSFSAVKRIPAASESLEDFLAAIKNASGFEICIYDFDFFLLRSPEFQVSRSIRGHCSPYCELVRSKPETYARCARTETCRIKTANRLEGDVLISTCYGGVTDMVIPLARNGKQIGAVFLGQVFTNTPEENHETFRQLTRDYGFSIEALDRAAQHLKRLSPRELEGYAPLLAGVKAHIEQMIEVADLRQEQDISRSAKRALEAFPAGEMSLEQLPTPTLDRAKRALRGPKSYRIQKAIAYLRTTYWEVPTCEQVARHVALSESHFSRLFREETGMTFRQCLLETRLNAAFYLIKRNGYTVEQAADLLGYESASSLQRAFKQFTGAAPQHFVREFPAAFVLDRFGGEHHISSAGFED